MSEEQERGSLTFLVGPNYMHLSYTQAHMCTHPPPTHTHMHTTSVTSTLIVVPTSQGGLGPTVSSANGDQGSLGCSENAPSGPGIPNFVLPEGKGSYHVGAVLVF